MSAFALLFDDARARRSRVVRVLLRAAWRKLRRSSAARRRLPRRAINLGYEQTLVLENAARTRIKVLFGSLWLTQQGDEQDYLAVAGEEVKLARAGRTVLAALSATRVEISE